MRREDIEKTGNKRGKRQDTYPRDDAGREKRQAVRSRDEESLQIAAYGACSTAVCLQSLSSVPHDMTYTYPRRGVGGWFVGLFGRDPGRGRGRVGQRILAHLDLHASPSIAAVAVGLERQARTPVTLKRELEDGGDEEKRKVKKN